MSQALFLSDHEILNDIYTLNLKAFVDVNVTLKNSLQETIDLIKLNPNFDVLITLSNIAGMDVAKELVQLKSELKLEFPIIVIGEKSSVSNTDQVITLAANFNIQNVVRTVAQSLGVTAREMAEKLVPEYYPIPLKSFYSFEKNICDVYINVSKASQSPEYVKIFGNGDKCSEENLKGYVDKGFKTLYIPSDFRLKFVNQASLNVLNQLNTPNLKPERKIEISEQGYEVVAQRMMTDEGKLNDEVVAISKKCVETVQDAMKGVPKLKNLLQNMLDNKTGYLYMHSVMATYVSNHIIKNISWGADEHADKIAFVLFFHDIFLTPIYTKFPEVKYEEDLIFNSKLSDKEKEVVLGHARLASEIVKNFPKCPMGADALILQHHGMSNGMGFAMDFKDDVSPLAKVIIIAEDFVANLLKQKEETSSVDIPDIISSLNEKYTRHTYKKIISTLENFSL